MRYFKNVFFVCPIIIVFFSNGFALDSVNTVGGILEKREIEDGEILFLNEKPIPKLKDYIVNIEKVFQIKNNTVVLVKTHPGGNEIPYPIGQFLTIKPNKTYTISSSFELPDYVVEQVGNKIMVMYEEHLDSKKGIRYVTIVYDNGNVIKKTGKVFRIKEKVIEKIKYPIIKIYGKIVKRLEEFCVTVKYGKEI